MAIAYNSHEKRMLNHTGEFIMEGIPMMDMDTIEELCASHTIFKGAEEYLSLRLTSSGVIVAFSSSV